MARIPIAADVAELVGPFAEGVQNRTLLLDKMVFHKKWGVDDIAANDAHRWSLLRLSREGTAELLRQSDAKKERASGRNVELSKAERYQRESRLARQLANTQAEAPDAQELRARHSKRFLELFRSAYGERCRVVYARLEARLAINLAEGILQNAGICLDRLFGLPFIPGSAVKGVTRHVALRHLKEASGLFDHLYRVFGVAENDFKASKKDQGDLYSYRELLGEHPPNRRGGIDFLPAYPIDAAKIGVDLTTVHYPDYYRTGKEEDLAVENPLPNPFPVVEAGTTFAFCLLLNGMEDDPDLLNQAEKWLVEALTVSGLGAKTSAGYGWFSIDRTIGERLAAEELEAARQAELRSRQEAEAQANAAAEEARLQQLTPEERALETLARLDQEAFAAKAKNLAEEDDATQRAFLRLLNENKEKRERWKTWKKKKPDLAQSIGEAAKRWNIPLP